MNLKEAFLNLVNRASRIEQGEPTAKPQVEALETRLTPTVNMAPTLTIDVVESDANFVRISGQVDDEIPGMAEVTLTGLINDTFQVEPDGSFTELYQVSGFGAISAYAEDFENLKSPTKNLNFSSAAPTITVDYIWDTTAKTVTVFGTVTDELPDLTNVTFSGAVTGTATVDAEGNFSATLQASEIGQITATFLDQWGQSASDSVTLQNNKPTISDFQAVPAGGNYFTISGFVNDEQPNGLMVQLGGVSTETIEVGVTGYFSITIELPPGTTGTLTATVTDWWGSVSDEVEDYLE